jgi:hypothetical protein
MPLFEQFSFSGGVNNEIEPYLLKAEQSADLLNANVNSGALVPFNDKLAVTDPNIDELTNQNGERSLIKFGTSLYWSDNSDSTLSSTLGYIGITPPTQPLNVTLGPLGDAFTGHRKYLFRFLTEEGFRSAPFLIDQDITIVDVNADQTSTIRTQGDYPELDVRHVYEHSHTKKRFWFGYRAGAKVNFEGHSYRARTDVYEARHRLEMTNTLPSNHTAWENIDSLSITDAGSESFSITDFDTAIESQVEFVEIYRTIENGSNYYFVSAVNVKEGTFVDSQSDSEIQTHTQLLEFNEFPPIYALSGGTWQRNGGKYLTEINEIFYLALGDRLFISKQSDPHSWNPAHNVRFDGEITGIAKIDDSIIVFVGNGFPWIVKGTVADGDLSKLPIPTTQGSPNWKTIAYAKGTPVWQSDDGLCGIIRRPLGQGWRIEVLSKSRYLFDSIANFALTYKDAYYLFFDDHAVVFDMGRDLFYRREITADYGYYNKVDGILYLVKDGQVFTLDDGLSQELTHLSAEYVFNDLNELKEANFLRIDADSDILYSIWYDGEEKVTDRTMALLDRKVRCERLPSGTFYRLQIEIKSNGKVRGYNVEWKNAS